MNFHLQLGMLSGPSAPPPIPPLPPTSARIVPPVKPKSKELTLYGKLHVSDVKLKMDEKFHCDDCGHSFATKGTLNRHKKNNCPRRNFRDRFNLVRHLNSKAKSRQNKVGLKVILIPSFFFIPNFLIRSLKMS
jgi:hypothetical protein